MSDFLRTLAEWAQFLWPFGRVMQWERGIYYVWGRRWRVVGPGIYPLVPWFMELRTQGVVQDVKVTELQTITTKDGGTLTFSATIKYIVADLDFAYNRVMHFEETALEDAAAILADRLADVDVAKFDPENRRQLIRSCRDALNKEMQEYGVSVERLRFNNFVRNMRAYRLFNDQHYRTQG